MPFVGAFHKIDTFTHDRMHHNADRFALAGHCFRFFQRGHHIIHIIPVHFKGGPAKCFKFLTDISQFHDLISRTVDLLTVPVDGGDQVINLMVGREHDRFPNLSFIQFTVTMQGEDEVLFTVKSFCQSGPDGYAHALSQGTGSDPYPGELFIRGGVALES